MTTIASLLAQVDVMAEAPGGVQRLRELILQLAVRGKLVAQDSSEGTAHDVLAAIASGSSGCTPTRQQEAYSLPATWTWVCLGAVAEQRLGKMLDKGKNRGVPHRYLRNTNVQWFRFDLADVKEMRFEADELDEYEVRLGDLLVCEGGEPGRGAVWPGGADRMMFQKALHRVRPAIGVNPWYVLYSLRAAADSGVLASYFTGATIKHMPGQAMQRFAFPLPPSLEQDRIVAKVDELMALCDELEERQQRRTHTRERCGQLMLRELASASNEASLDASWQRLTHCFEVISEDPESIEDLSRAIRQLAVQGRLVAQNDAEEPASALLERVGGLRASHGADGRATRARRVQVPSPAIVPFQVPSAWQWTTLGMLTDPSRTLSYGVLVPGPDVADGVPFVRVQDVTAAERLDRPVKTIARDVEAPYARTRLQGGEILIGVVGSIGTIGIVPPEWAGANIARALCRFAPAGELNRDYLALVLRSPYVQDYFREATRTLAQPTLNVSQLERTPIPVPPVAEQARIVERVNELMSLCDALEARLTLSRDRAGHLAASLVHHLTAA